MFFQKKKNVCYVYNLEASPAGPPISKVRIKNIGFVRVKNIKNSSISISVILVNVIVITLSSQSRLLMLTNKEACHKLPLILSKSVWAAGLKHSQN